MEVQKTGSGHKSIWNIKGEKNMAYYELKIS